jgi:hypothetical protein
MEPDKQIIDVKDAVKRAMAYFQDLMQSSISDIWLEEVELLADEKWWRITLSALAPARKEGNTISNILAQSERLYRIFMVDSRTGQVRSMKIRALQSQ